MKRENVYLRMRYRVSARQGETLTVGDVAIIAECMHRAAISALPIYSITPNDQNIVIIDMMQVIEKINEFKPSLDIQSIGPTETIVTVQQKKRRLTPIYFILVWLLLFIGAGLAIMNFHEDVSMNEVHHRIFRLVTGNDTVKPLLLQIPYSIGLGLGMILFFNHFFKKRFSEEPSPLEIEMFQYQEALDQYVKRHDHKLDEYHAD